MQLSILTAPRPKIIRPGIPRIDPGHWLAPWIIGAYMPGVTRGFNLTGTGPNLTPDTGVKFAQNVEGIALDGSAANTGWYATCDARWKSWTVGFSFYARASYVVTIANPVNIIGVVYDNAVGSPYQVAALMAADPQNMFLQWNHAGTLVNGTVSGAVSTGMHGFGASFTVGGNAEAYLDGVLQTTNAFGAGAPASTATSQVNIGLEQGVNSRNTGMYINVALGISRALTAAEQAMLDADPYGMFIWPGDEIFAYWKGTPPPPFTAKFRKTLSQIGGRVGTRQLAGWWE